MQIADVSVDTETGIVQVNRYVAVQDCGLVVNPRLAREPGLRRHHHGHLRRPCSRSASWTRRPARMLNADMEFYKLAGIGDIGEIVVHMDIRPENDKRGVIGLGEPPAVAICAAIGNAVANAIGVRVPNIPMTPRSRAGRAGREERVMQAFEYANPASLQEALGLLAPQLGRGRRAGRRHRPASA